MPRILRINISKQTWASFQCLGVKKSGPQTGNISLTVFRRFPPKRLKVKSLTGTKLANKLIKAHVFAEWYLITV